MANQEHLEILRRGVEAWNRWRAENPDIKPYLVMAELRHANLSGADLNHANLSGAGLNNAMLNDANLTEIDLSGADLSGAMLQRANLRRADLSGALLRQASLIEADFTEAVLSGADLYRANLGAADLSGAELDTANFSEATLAGANLMGATLTNTFLTGATLSEARLDHAKLSGCRIYGLAASNIQMAGATQADLIVSAKDEAKITVDTLAMAHWVDTLVHNALLPDVVEIQAARVVLILGWYIPERQPLFDGIRAALRRCGYVPILFDYAFPTPHDLNETLVRLARVSRFVIADLTCPMPLPNELLKFAGELPSVPVQPIVCQSQRPAPLEHLPLLPMVEYASRERFIDEMMARVIEAAERKIEELRG